MSAAVINRPTTVSRGVLALSLACIIGLPTGRAAAQASAGGDAADPTAVTVQVIPANEATLSSQMAGRIARLAVRPGDAVTAGQELLRFDCAEVEARRDALKAESNGARETHVGKMRLQALGAAGELEVTLAAVAAEKARATLRQVDAQIAWCSVTAPYAGRVARVRVRAQESVGGNQALLDLVGEGKVRARLFMPTAQATSLRPGQRLAARFGASGVRHAIVVESISPRVDGASQLVEIEGRFDGPTAGLTPGMVGLVERAARTTGGQGS